MLRLDSKDVAGLMRSCGTSRRGIVRGEPIPRPHQAIISEQICGNSSASHVCHWRVFTVLEHHRPWTIASGSSPWLPFPRSPDGEWSERVRLTSEPGRFPGTLPRRSPGDPVVPSRRSQLACPWCHSPCWTLSSHLPRFLPMNCEMWVLTTRPLTPANQIAARCSSG